MLEPVSLIKSITLLFKASVRHTKCLLEHVCFILHPVGSFAMCVIQEIENLFYSHSTKHVHEKAIYLFNSPSHYLEVFFFSAKVRAVVSCVTAVS